MKRVVLRSILLFALGPFLGACATFDPGVRPEDLTRPRQPTVREAMDGLEISVEEFVSDRKSRHAFDADLASRGVLALLVRVENRDEVSYKVLRDDIKAFLGEEPLEPLMPADAAGQAATSEYAGKALFWTAAAGPFAILLWPSTIAGSVTHTSAVNRKIRQHFESLEFTDTLLRPK